MKTNRSITRPLKRTVLMAVAIVTVMAGLGFGFASPASAAINCYTYKGTTTVTALCYGKSTRNMHRAKAYCVPYGSRWGRWVGGRWTYGSHPYASVRCPYGSRAAIASYDVR